MNTQELTVQGGVHEYVEAVRAALADLAPDVVDDLTEGLEADLADQVSESPAGMGTLPAATAYAAELRSAAGLPEDANTTPTPRWWEQDAWTPTVAAWTRAKAENRWLSAAAGLAEELRPVGWVARGIVLALVVGAFLGLTHPWLLGAAFAAVSVWAGRNRHRARGFGRTVLVGASALAVVAALPAYWVGLGRGSDQSVNVVDQLGDGMYFHGQPVNNIYLYGTDGTRLTNVRAFDDAGHPLDLSTQHVRSDGTPLPAVSDQFGAAWTNLLPVDLEANGDPWGGVAGSVNGSPGGWEAPRMLAPLDPSTMPSSPEASTTSSTTPTPAPSSPEPSPTASSGSTTSTGSTGSTTPPTGKPTK